MREDAPAKTLIPIASRFFEKNSLPAEFALAPPWYSPPWSGAWPLDPDSIVTRNHYSSKCWSCQDTLDKTMIFLGGPMEPACKVVPNSRTGCAWKATEGRQS